MENNKFTIGDTVSFGGVICKVDDILGNKNNYTYDIYEVNGDGIYFDIPEEKLEFIS
jgi:hypothetical protein